MKTCPTCKKEWPREIKDLIPVGEDAVRAGDSNKRRESDSGSDAEEEPPLDNSPPTRASRRKGKGKAKETEQMEVDDDDDDAQEELAQTPPTQRPRRNARR